MPIITAADNIFCDSFPNFRKKRRYDNSWESSAGRRFSWNIIPYLLFLKMSSAANYRLHFMGYMQPQLHSVYSKVNLDKVRQYCTRLLYCDIGSKKILTFWIFICFVWGKIKPCHLELVGVCIILSVCKCCNIFLVCAVLFLYHKSSKH